MVALAQSPGRRRAAILLAAAPPLAFSAWLGYVLLWPLASAATRQWAVDASLLMVMEFVLVHSWFVLLVALSQPTKLDHRLRRIAPRRVRAQGSRAE